MVELKTNRGTGQPCVRLNSSKPELNCAEHNQSQSPSSFVGDE